MKKYLIPGLVALAASFGAYAAPLTVCDASAIPQVATQVPVGTFVLVAFTPKCSNNVILSGEDNGTYYSVASASKKGKTAFMGSSAGGGIVPATGVTCPATGCTATEVGTAQTAATAISS